MLTLSSQALEAGDKQLCAKLYAVQADAYVGLGGQAMTNGSSYENEIAQADLFLDKAGQCEYYCTHHNITIITTTTAIITVIVSSKPLSYFPFKSSPY